MAIFSAGNGAFRVNGDALHCVCVVADGGAGVDLFSQCCRFVGLTLTLTSRAPLLPLLSFPVLDIPSSDLRHHAPR